MKLKRPNPFYGWYVVAAVFVISAFVSGIVSFGYTAVVDPIADEFGWSYASISFAGSIRGLEIGLLAPIVGILIDRIGVRVLIFVGGLFIGLGLLTLSHSDALFSFYASYMMIAAGMSTCKGIAMIGSITGQPLVGWLFDVQGTYRWTWLIFAAANLFGIISLFTTPYGEGRMLKKKSLSENERNQK